VGRSGHGYLWAELMRRTFGFDVLACPRCGGCLRLVALIEQAAVIARILIHIGLPTAVPRRGPHDPRRPTAAQTAGPRALALISISTEHARHRAFRWRCACARASPCDWPAVCDRIRG